MSLSVKEIVVKIFMVVALVISANIFENTVGNMVNTFVKNEAILGMQEAGLDIENIKVNENVYYLIGSILFLIFLSYFGSDDNLLFGLIIAVAAFFLPIPIIVYVMFFFSYAITKSILLTFLLVIGMLLLFLYKVDMDIFPYH